jgi:hypothetical protein
LVFQDCYNLSEIERLVGWPRGRIRTLTNPTAYPATADREAFEVKLPLEPLLTEEQWNRAQTLLAARTTWTKATANPRFLAAG